MDDNPYQPPSTDASAASSGGMDNVHSDGKYLIVNSGVVLSPYCVKTGTAVRQQDLRQKRLSWCPPIVGLLILVSGFSLILVYFIARKHCIITFGLSPVIRKKYRNRRIFKMLAVIALLFALPLTAPVDSTAIVTAVLVLFVVALVSLFVGNSPLP